MIEMIILNSILRSAFLIYWLCFSVFLSCSHFGQDNLCSPSDILQLNLSVKRTVETLLSLGAHSEESSFVCLSIQLLGFVAFYCTVMLTLCMLYYWLFPSSWKIALRWLSTSFLCWVKEVCLSFRIIYISAFSPRWPSKSSPVKETNPFLAFADVQPVALADTLLTKSKRPASFSPGHPPILLACGLVSLPINAEAFLLIQFWTCTSNMTCRALFPSHTVQPPSGRFSMSQHKWWHCGVTEPFQQLLVRKIIVPFLVLAVPGHLDFCFELCPEILNPPFVGRHRSV